MVDLLFEGSSPTTEDRILFPGVGDGPFIKAVENYCESNDCEFPEGVAIDTHEGRLATAEERFEHLPIEFICGDFLIGDINLSQYDYILCNPPYVPITELGESEKREYKSQFTTATGRFDLYLLFYERTLDLLTPDGRMCIVTPEKFEYVETARPLRKLLSEHHLTRLEHLDQGIFPGHVTYPTVSIVDNTSGDATTVVSRDGSTRTVQLPDSGDRWTDRVRDIDHDLEKSGYTLDDITERISPGIATGADAVFVFEKDELPNSLRKWARPTISGKQLQQQSVADPVDTSTRFVCPYDDNGNIQTTDTLEKFYNRYESRLKERSCVRKEGKHWWAWHENPPMEDILQEKILFRDITDDPAFWIDDTGDILPRHTVYYAIPKDGVDLPELHSYLNQPEVSLWLHANCQLARNDYLRLQSSVLSELPVPQDLVPDAATLLVDDR